MAYLHRERDLRIDRFRDRQERYLSTALLVDPSGKAEFEFEDIRDFLEERMGVDDLSEENAFHIFKGGFAVMEDDVEKVIEQKADELSTVGFTDTEVSLNAQLCS